MQHYNYYCALILDHLFLYTLRIVATMDFCMHVPPVLQILHISQLAT